MAPSRFAGRRLDQLWFSFCVLHLLISLLIDLQPLYPAQWFASTPLPAFFHWAVNLTRDPIMLAAAAPDKGGAEFLWLRCFTLLEAGFQVPCFVLGAVGLWKSDKRVYPLLLAYGASTATTLLPCLAAIWSATPSPAFSNLELISLFAEYLPFLVLPLGMAADMGVRVGTIISAAEGRKRV